MKTGQLTLTGTGTPQAFESDLIAGEVILKAPTGNSQILYIGNSVVTSGTGFLLDKGDTVELIVSNMKNIYVTGTSGDVVTYIAKGV